MSTAIRIENVSKLYRLGTVGTGTLSHDLNRWWHTIRGKDDPYAKVGQVNDRTQAASNDPRETSEGNGDFSPLASRHSSLRPSGPDYVWALKDINLEVQQGELLGIIGRNGAGKSTLLKLLSRVTAPTTGSIKTKGRIASLLEVGTGFHPELTGRENVYMNGAILGMRRHEITRQLDQIIAFSGCAKYVDTPVKRYSSGMMVRLAFSVAAHLTCEILIVDEVLAVGDASFQSKCFERMTRLNEIGTTVILVTHQMHTARRLCRRGIILDCGAVYSNEPITKSIDRYLELNRIAESTGSADIHPDRAQNFITRAQVKAQKSNAIAQISMDDDIEIALTINGAGLNGLRCGLTISDSLDFPIAQIHSTDSAFDISPYQNNVNIVVPALCLVPGDYNISITLGDDQSQLLEQWNRAILFKVIASRNVSKRTLTSQAGLIVAKAAWFRPNQ